MDEDSVGLRPACPTGASRETEGISHGRSPYAGGPQQSRRGLVRMRSTLGRDLAGRRQDQNDQGGDEDALMLQCAIGF